MRLWGLGKMGARKRWWWLILLALPVSVLLWKINLYFGYPLTPKAAAMRGAQAAYQSSRSGAPRSYKFLTFGLVAGMTEDDVERTLPSPAHAFRRQTVADPHWEGWLNTYKFEHGPICQAPWENSAHPLCTEILHVFFDRSGRAVKITLQQFGEVPLFSESGRQLQLRPPGEGNKRGT